MWSCVHSALTDKLVKLHILSPIVYPVNCFYSPHVKQWSQLSPVGCFALNVCVLHRCLAGSWTIWNTTWSWRSRTARAGRATRRVSTATDSTWLRSSCSATSRVLTAPSNPQVQHDDPQSSLYTPDSLVRVLVIIYNFPSLSLFQPTARYVSWHSSQSKCSWNTWRIITSPGKCLMSARSVPSRSVRLRFNVWTKKKKGADADIFVFFRCAITGHLSSQTWRLISEVSMETPKTCSVPSASKSTEVVTCTCSTTWNIRYNAELNPVLLAPTVRLDWFCFLPSTLV